MSISVFYFPNKGDRVKSSEKRVQLQKKAKEEKMMDKKDMGKMKATKFSKGKKC